MNLRRVLFAAFVAASVIVTACGGAGSGGASPGAKPAVTVGSTNFYEQLTEQVEEYLETHRLHDYLVGDKQQAVYQLPEGERYLAELRESIGKVCGLDPAELVLSERHIKLYDPDATPKMNSAMSLPGITRCCATRSPARSW